MDASADLLKVNHRLESRVPEIGLLGSEGGATSSVVPTPIPCHYGALIFQRFNNGNLLCVHTAETFQVFKRIRQRRSFLISAGSPAVSVATGLGKTWLAAFDVRAAGKTLERRPRVLIVAHRAE